MRKYKNVVFHSASAVMFYMENGWYYLVYPGHDYIAAFMSPDFYVRFNPYVKPGPPPDDDFKKAEFLLHTLPVRDGLSNEKFDETQPNTWKKKKSV